MLDSRVVANKFIELAKVNSSYMTIMKLLKLVYIAHGWSLGVRNLPLIKDDVQAWQYGPVIPAVYDAFRNTKGRQITSPAVFWGMNEQINQEDESFIETIYNLYKEYSGPQLSTITHMPNTPWSNVYDGTFGKVIPLDMIADHYKQLYQQRYEATNVERTA